MTEAQGVQLLAAMDDVQRLLIGMYMALGMILGYHLAVTAWQALLWRWWRPCFVLGAVGLCLVAGSAGAYDLNGYTGGPCAEANRWRDTDFDGWTDCDEARGGTDWDDVESYPEGSVAQAHLFWGGVTDLINGLRASGDLTERDASLVWAEYQRTPANAMVHARNKASDLMESHFGSRDSDGNGSSDANEVALYGFYNGWHMPSDVVGDSPTTVDSGEQVEAGVTFYEEVKVIQGAVDDRIAQLQNYTVWRYAIDCWGLESAGTFTQNNDGVLTQQNFESSVNGMGTIPFADLWYLSDRNYETLLTDALSDGNRPIGGYYKTWSSTQMTDPVVLGGFKVATIYEACSIERTAEMVFGVSCAQVRASLLEKFGGRDSNGDGVLDQDHIAKGESPCVDKTGELTKKAGDDVAKAVGKEAATSRSHAEYVGRALEGDILGTKDAIQETLNAVGGAITTAIDAAATFTVDGIGTNVAYGVGAAVHPDLVGIKGSQDETRGEVMNVKGAVDGVGGKVDGVGNAVDGVGGKVDGMSNSLGGKLDGIGDGIDGLGTGLGGKLDGIGDKLDGIAGQIGEGGGGNEGEGEGGVGTDNGHGNTSQEERSGIVSDAVMGSVSSSVDLVVNVMGEGISGLPDLPVDTGDEVLLTFSIPVGPSQSKSGDGWFEYQDLSIPTVHFAAWFDVHFPDNVGLATVGQVLDGLRICVWTMCLFLVGWRFKEGLLEVFAG